MSERSLKEEQKQGGIMKIGILILAFFAILAVALSLQADSKFSGDMIGEYYYVAQSHNDSIESNNGFWFRRIYFTCDNKPDDKIRIRLRIEMGSPGDFSTKSKLIPAVKNASISYKLTPSKKAVFGIQSPPTFEKIEHIWGYRSLEKTPLDMQKWASSRDFGISLSGKKSFFSYNIMFGNNSSNKSETDKAKKIYTSVGITPLKGVYFEFYGDYGGINSDKKKDYIMQGFASYSSSPTRIGILFSRKGDTEDTVVYNILSGFGVFAIKENIDVIIRYDRMFQANAKGEAISYIPFSNISPSSFILAGVSYSIHKNIKIMPNIEYVIYDTSSVSADVYPRLTLYYKW